MGLISSPRAKSLSGEVSLTKVPLALGGAFLWPLGAIEVRNQAKTQGKCYFPSVTLLGSDIICLAIAGEYQYGRQPP